ncbi:ubl carboxyl-terminal hydrolase 18 [Spea bombifrons]|uniref:ubl carboxyl-terminal hydrolase 18 n=1 Tax=Spea bombifrons TaxID=233779 RepID=UPI0023495B75|nr:ubl carboxyl-terminal hydrolase 18 [Spea bombifrons]
MCEEDGYLNEAELLEDPETEEDASSSWHPGKPLSYSTGTFKNGAIGLSNIGVKSCLNSLLQTFYMNEDFADILCRIGEATDNVPLERSFPYELLALFEEMQDSEEDAVSPYRILSCLRTHKVRLFSPYDVAELFSTLVNLLLEQMPHPYLEEKLRNLYTIRLEESMTCLKCSNQRSSDTNLLTIHLQVYHSRYHRTMTLERGLRRFFKTKKASGGESWCICPKCGEDSKSVKDERLRSLPRTLTVDLKRIRQRKSSQLQKINRTLTFPPTLDLSEVLDPEHLPEQEYAQSQYIYNIFAVVAHSGTPNSGHFCTYIKSSKDQKWYCFNDSSVCRVSWDDVKCAYGNTIFHWGVTACLLIYIQSDGK